MCKTILHLVSITLFYISLSSCTNSKKAETALVVEEPMDSVMMTGNPYAYADSIANTVPNETLETAADRLQAARSNKDFLEFIKDFIIADFSRSRKDLIDQNIGDDYTVSEITERGSSMFFEVKFKDFSGEQIYMCTPDMGENSISFTGNKEVAQDLYNQAVLSKKWNRKDNDGKNKVAEVSEDWNEKPLSSKLTITYIERENEAVMITNRKITLN